MSSDIYKVIDSNGDVTFRGSKDGAVSAKLIFGGSVQPEFHVGQIVKFRPDRCTERERDTLHVIAEWNGDRGYIQPVKTTMRIIPSELVRDTDIEAA